MRSSHALAALVLTALPAVVLAAVTAAQLAITYIPALQAVFDTRAVPLWEGALVLLTGVGGLTSFGQAAFVGVGAYTTAVLTTADNLPG